MDRPTTYNPTSARNGSRRTYGVVWAVAQDLFVVRPSWMRVARGAGEFARHPFTSWPHPSDRDAAASRELQERRRITRHACSSSRLACESPRGHEPPRARETGADIGQPRLSALGCQLGPAYSLPEGAICAAGRSLPGMSLAFALMAVTVAKHHTFRRARMRHPRRAGSSLAWNPALRSSRVGTPATRRGDSESAARRCGECRDAWNSIAPWRRCISA
jgi:hypothetical protein